MGERERESGREREWERERDRADERGRKRERERRGREWEGRYRETESAVERGRAGESGTATLTPLASETPGQCQPKFTRFPAEIQGKRRSLPAT